MNKAITPIFKDLLTVGETWGATIEKVKPYSNPVRHELRWSSSLSIQF